MKLLLVVDPADRWVICQEGQIARLLQFSPFASDFPSKSGNGHKDDSGPRRHAKVTTTLDLYSKSIDASKLDAQKHMAMAITNGAEHFTQFTGEELQVKFLSDSEENSLSG